MWATRVPLLLVALAYIATPARADDDYGRGFGYCAPAPKPSCMTADATFRDKDSLAGCDARVQHFITSLAAYRTCLLQLSGTTVAKGNDALSAYRCRSGQKDRCR